MGSPRIEAARRRHPKAAHPLYRQNAFRPRAFICSGPIICHRLIRAGLRSGSLLSGRAVTISDFARQHLRVTRSACVAECLCRDILSRKWEIPERRDIRRGKRWVETHRLAEKMLGAIELGISGVK